MEHWIRGFVFNNESSIECLETLKARIHAAVQEISAETRYPVSGHFEDRLQRCVEKKGLYVET